MAIKYIPRVDGVATATWNYGKLTRASVAWCPDTGKAKRFNEARIVEKRIPILNWKQELFYTFTEPQTKYTYATYLTRLGTWDTYAAANGWTKVAGTAQSYLGLDIPYYLRPKTGTAIGDIQTTKIFVVTCVCHGNEVDGLNGVFKAMETLSTNPRFAAFRAEWSILFLPCMNPDGFNANTRGSGHVNPDPLKPYRANLNRNFDWFWDEYTESGSEWKGSAPESEPEVSWLCDYERACVAAGGSFGCLCDMHATEAFGTRYYTRDRLNHHITKTRTQGGDVPTSWITQSLQDIIWRMSRSCQIKRYLETADGKPYFVRLLKSRYDPKMHSYFSSRGAYSTVFEEAKVAEVVLGTETIASACNCRLDHILNTAAAVTEANWSYEDAVLIEKETTNELHNANFFDWNGTENRPDYWSSRRATLENATRTEGETFLTDANVVKLTSHISITLDTASEFNSCCCTYSSVDTSYSNLFAMLSYGKILWYPNNGSDTLEYVSSHTTPYGTVVCPAGDKVVDVLGGGTAEEVGAGSSITRVDFNTTPPVETHPATVGLLVRTRTAYCDNTLSFPASTAFKGYIFGGIDNAGTVRTTIGTWNPATLTYTAAVAVLPVALFGALAVYCPGATPCVYIFGGKDNVGTIRTEIYKWVPSTGILTTLPAVLPVATFNSAGFYSPDDFNVYVFGGQIIGSAMTSSVYQFDPTTEGIVAVTPIWQSSGEYGDYVDVPWTTAVGRWTGCMAADNSADTGTPMLIGGRETNTTGPLRAECLTFNVTDVALSAYGTGDWAYLNPNSVVDMRYATQVSDNFTTLDNWGTGGSWVSTGTSARCDAQDFLRLMSENPDYANQKVSIDIKYNTGASTPEFSVELRRFGAHNGYFLDYTNGVSKVWTLMNGDSGGDILGTLDVTLDATRQLSATAHTLTFEARGKSPVHLVATYNGLSLFDLYDLEVGRVTGPGIIFFRAWATPGDYWDIANFVLETGGFDEEIYSLTGYTKTGAGSEYAYDRLTMVPKSYEGDQKSTRYVSTYFATPPTVGYVQRKVRIDMLDGKRAYREDGMWIYHRVYKDLQVQYLTGFHLQKGSMIPSSYMAPDTTREDEIFTFENILNINNFVLNFRFMPTACFAELRANLEFCRIYVDVDNYISLSYVYPTDLNTQQAREYNLGYDYDSQSVDGTLYDGVVAEHDPTIRLTKIVGGFIVDSIDMISYFGYSNLNEEACEATTDAMDITITNLAGQGMELKLVRAGNEGRKFSAADTTRFASNDGSLQYTGVGYFSQPDILDTVYEPTGRAVSSRRAGLVNRLRNKQRHQLLGGDRDPSLGDDRGGYYYELQGDTFGVGDAFTRGDNVSIGGNWKETRSYYGWGINTNRARCSTSRGLCRWKQFPKHADYRISADIRIDDIGNVITLLGHWDWRDGGTTTGDVTGYGMEMYPGGGGMMSIQMSRYYRYYFDTGLGEIYWMQAYVVPYILGTTVNVSLDFVGSTITSTFGSEAPVSATDTCFPRAGYVGFYGDPTVAGVGKYVYLDNWSMHALFSNDYE